MSQAGIISTTAGPVPPSVPTSFVTDSGTAIPALNILNVNGAERPAPLTTVPDNDAGLQTYANPNLSNNLAIFLTNRRVDTASISGAGTVDLFTQDLGAVPGVYNFQLYASGFNASTPAGAAYTIFGSVRTTGAAATVIVTQDIISDEEPALLGADFEIVASGNNLIARATGVAGLTINFKVLATYIFVGA